MYKVIRSSDRITLYIVDQANLEIKFIYIWLNMHRYYVVFSKNMCSIYEIFKISLF